jgi:mannose-1-phosphate guanylyltransferase
MTAVEAILLVGGQGSRLRPLTISTPKPMLPTAGVPFVTHQLTKLRDAGVDHVILATSYRADVFEPHFGDGSGLGLRLDYLSEKEPLGTGGGIRNAAAALDGGPDGGPVLVLNGDVLSGVDLAALLETHERNDALVSLYLTEVADPRAFGVVPTDDDGKVLQFLEKTPDPPTNQINAGCYVFGRSAFDAIPAGSVVSVERDTFPSLLAAGARIYGHVDTSYWLDVGTPAAFVQASCDLVRGIAPSTAVPGPPHHALVMPGAVLEPGAVLTGGTVLGAGSHVAAGARLDGCVVFDGATVEAHAYVSGSVIGLGASVGEGARIEGALIGDGARVGARCELLGGVRLFPGVELPAAGIRFSSDR